MSKIPQRIKEPSSYARIFAKHKASQPRKDDADEVHETRNNHKRFSHEEPPPTHTNAAGSQGIFGESPGISTSRVPAYANNSCQGKEEHLHLHIHVHILTYTCTYTDIYMYIY